MFDASNNGVSAPDGGAGYLSLIPWYSVSK